VFMVALRKGRGPPSALEVSFGNDSPSKRTDNQHRGISMILRCGLLLLVPATK